MKRRFLILISLVVTITVLGGEVTQEQAFQKARAFLKGKQIMPGKVMQTSPKKGETGKANNAFYVFNAVNDNGFVIISGDDRTREVLGYGEHGNLDTDYLPENVKWWLDSYTRQIEALGTSLKPAPKSAGDVQKEDVNPLVTAQWDQAEPYNLMCPDGNYVDYYEEGYDTSNRCVSGCVATAMAQVMNYWQWPESCPEIAGYTFKKHTVKGLASTTFKWNLMKDTYKNNETGEEAMAVAELMRYCGQAVKMQYTPESSAASLSPSILASVFQYSCNTRNLSRDGYTTSQWESIVYDELAAGRPVLYTGLTSDNEGHEFTIDGYDKETGLFHINWGWGGSLDSYYVLSIADPGNDQGIGGSTGAFQFKQTAMIGMKPAVVDEVIKPIFTSKMDNSTSEAGYSRSNISDGFTDVALKGTVDVNYTIAPQSETLADIGWALYQDDTFIAELGSNKYAIPIIPEGKYGSFSNNLTVSFGADLTAGKYKLCQVFRLDGETEWTLCDEYGTNFIYAEVTETSLTVRLPYINVSQFEVNSVVTSDYPEVGTELSVTVNMTNAGESNKLAVNLWTQEEGESVWTNSASSTCALDPGMSGDIVLTFVPEKVGTYNLKITAKDSEEALKTAIVNIADKEQIVVDSVPYICTPTYKRARITRNNAYKTTQSMSIPKAVTSSESFGSVICDVKAIDDKALYNWYRLEELVVPEGVETIGYQAFAFCFKLKKLELPSTLTSLGKEFILADDRLLSVILHAAEPFAVPEEAFRCGSYDRVTKQVELGPLQATLYVPYGSKAAYKAAAYWNTFKEIVEIGDANGDGEIDIADAVCIVNHVVGKETPQLLSDAADANGDGDIDIADAVCVVKDIMVKSE